MGTTSKVFTFKRKYLGIKEIINIVNDIYTKLIDGDEIKYYASFRYLNNLNVNKLSNDLGFSISKLLIHFKNNNPLELNDILTHTNDYEHSYFYSHKKNIENKPFIGYSFDVSTEPEDFKFKICLPYLDEIEKSKKELITLTKYLVNKEVFFMVKYDIDKIMSDIIDVNTGLSCGSWSFKDRVEISAYGNFTPHGSRIPRPADVRFIFCESHYNKYGGTINMLIVLHKELCTYFRKNGYHIQGNITTKNGLNLLRNLKKKSFFDIEIPLSIDLCKYNKIDILKIFDMSGISDIKLVLKNFYWKNTKKQYDSSRLYVWIDKEMKCNFQIEIDKEIDEEDLIFIETEINEEFEYIGYQ